MLKEAACLRQVLSRRLNIVAHALFEITGTRPCQSMFESTLPKLTTLCIKSEIVTARPK